MDPARYAELFLSESREHLSRASKALLVWEREPADTAPVQELFRSFHTLKGMAAAMGYEQVATAAHLLESVLDEVRSGRTVAGAGLIDTMLRAVDALEAAVEAAVEGTATPPELEAVTAALGVNPEAPSGAAPPRRRAAPARPHWVQVDIDPASPQRGARAFLALERARQLGAVSQVQPPASQFVRDNFPGTFRFHLLTEATAERVARVIEQTGDVSTVLCQPVGERAVASPEGGRPKTVRVDLRRLDTLLNQVGELVVAKNRLTNLWAARDEDGVEEVLAKLGRQVSEVQAQVMLARLTPVDHLFDRFPRAVRDLARELGKEVVFEVEGHHIEIDRAILDEIGDPLIHLLRNAIDHGLESPEDRRAAGKPPRGRLTLSAYRERNSVAFRVADDGRGIDREAILAKARREGRVSATLENLPDGRLLEVLGQAGFSTARVVTNVSGRGVGIDVVLSRVRELGGSVEIDSVLGRGTTVTLHLPRTLVVVRGLLAKVGEERYVIPVTYVAETLSVDRASRTEVDGREAVVLRNDVIPTVRLRQVVGLNGSAEGGGGGGSRREPCVILAVGRRRTALMVDALLGQEEIVVEPFDPPRGTPPLFSGAAILADGLPSLILDAAAMV